ncbi:UDP-glycosyltransferase 83A1-like [Sesamum indicum]|uniref:Glycosyltransferase n=1 Tax=Sesamum indicum TaxID=4182 RepID=A0A6I9SS19_SESIN|nr:UDP-glycosyltransferase 83A1-like [Sesamum indicum]
MENAIRTHRNSQDKNETVGHILIIPCPLQGHAAPLMKLSHQIIKLGTNVTFLTTDLIHARLTESKSWDQGLWVISIPDGPEFQSGCKDQVQLHAGLQRVMPGYLENLLKEANQSSKMDDSICGVIVDAPMAWMMEIPKKMGIKVAVFWCSTPGCLALGFKIPELLESKFIDSDGTPLHNENIQLLPSLPAMNITDLVWYFPSDPNTQKSMFHVIKDIMRHMQNANWVLCNWFQELNPGASNLSQNILSIGPLLANGQSSGSFCSEDSTCLSWLDKHPKSSVVYVAFGSTSRFSQQQLDELALGLEIMGRPFLWVAWSGLKDGSSPAYTNEYTERVAGRGKIVEWAPQEAVLSHPSTACFVTHCGWSSFMESLIMGVPLLCWPYFGDQLYTRTCVCDAWRVGMRLKPDEGGLVSRYEIKNMVEEVLSDGSVRENVLRLKGMARNSISKGGSTLVNLEYFLKQIKC